MTQARREETEAAILEAARTLFAEAGFGQVGVRDVAAAAGVNAALVIRYFGSKEALFEAAVTQNVELDGLFEGSTQQLGEVLVRFMLSKEDTGALLALLRSAANDQAARLLRRDLEALFIAPLSGLMKGRDKRLRAGLVAAQLLGIALARDVVGSDVLTEAEEAKLIRLYAPQVQALIGD